MLHIAGAVAQPITLSMADLRARFPAYSVDTSYANEVRVAKASYTGARLWDILQDTGVQAGALAETTRITAQAADGFQCDIGWREFDPSGENKLILVAYLQNGQPIQNKYGPLRLVVPGDSQGLRYIGNLIRLIVVTDAERDK